MQMTYRELVEMIANEWNIPREDLETSFRIRRNGNHQVRVEQLGPEDARHLNLGTPAMRIVDGKDTAYVYPFTMKNYASKPRCLVKLRADAIEGTNDVQPTNINGGWVPGLSGHL